MPSSLDLHTSHIASQSNNDPTQVWAFIDEHIQRLNRVESALHIIHTPLYEEARLHAHVYKEAPLRGSSFVISEKDIDLAAIYPLIDKGAIPIAKLKKHCDPLYLASVINPWSRKHIAGGSEAAAVSCGAAVFSICADQCGELILSANFCGTPALRPTKSISPFGWHARSVADLETIFYCATGQRTFDEIAPPTVWYLTDYQPYQLSKRVTNMMYLALEHLQMISLCFPMDIPLFSQAFSIWASNWNIPSGYAPKHSTGLMAQMMSERIHLLYPSIGRNLQIIRADIRAGLIQLLGDDGVFICPAYPQCVPESAESHTPLDFIFSAFFCDLDLPALHVPMGFCGKGIPQGVQIIAAPQQEKNLFAMGKLLEAEFKGWTRSQPFFINMPFNP